MRDKRILKVLAVGIFLLAAFFRLYGVNWDQGQHLHPDERFLTMVANGISWPKDLGEYLDTATSPLNPHNRGFGFFVYGTFPVFLTKWVAESLNMGDYNNLTIVGRVLSALTDLGMVILVFLIAIEISKSQAPSTRSQINIKSKKRNSKLFGFWNLGFICHLDFGIWVFPLVAMFLYSIMVLPIQLSHFYAVDTYLTFFITLSFYLLIKIITSKYILHSKFMILNSLLGVSFSLALASKISGILFLPVIGLGLLIKSIKSRKLFFPLIVPFSLFLVASYFTFRIAQPYAFANGNIFDPTPNPKLIDNWKQLESFMKPDSGFPPSVQWFGIKPFLFPFASLILWGLGLPLGLITIAGIFDVLFLVVYKFLKILQKKQLTITNSQLIIFLSLVWVLLLFLYEGSQPAPTIRYFHVIYPFLAIIAGFFLIRLWYKWKKISFAILTLTLIWPISFIQIYSHLHSRVSASSWIYSHIPTGATIAIELWDDGLPVTLDSQRINQLYKYVSLPLYDPDRPEKWSKISKLLEQSDYIILTSNRLWGSITKAPKLFPQASRYYQFLFNGSLGFKKIAEITSFPSLPLPLGNNCFYLFPPQEERLKLATNKNGIFRLDKCDIYEGINYQGIVIRDELAEETFTVYDHPKVLIFKKVKPVDYLNLLDDHNYKN